MSDARIRTARLRWTRSRGLQSAPEAEADDATAALHEAIAENDDPPFDPPDAEEMLVMCGARETPRAEAEIQPPPFDLAEAANETLVETQDETNAPVFEHCVAPEPEADMVLVTPAAPLLPTPRFAGAGRADFPLEEQPAPPISIFASWDRPEVAEVLNSLAGDRRLARAQIDVARGGLDGAVVRLSAGEAPNLIIIDTNLRAPEILAGVDRLAPAIERGAKVIVLGAVNDVTLLRALAARGVTKYIVGAAARDDLARLICGLFGDAAEGAFESRVIAVIGARGGVGASTVAHNLAWSIAERQETGATLLDLDLPFGTAGFNFHQDAPRSIADALLATDHVDDDLLARVATRPTPRLQMLTAPARLDGAPEIDSWALDAVISRARRSSPFVVLDLPHLWTAWVKQTLLTADDVVIVAGPDLASLRNTKNLLELLKAARPTEAEPLVALSMVGARKRPEIPFREFAKAIGAVPVASFGFDPALFGVASIHGVMIGEAAPHSKAAADFDTLATLLTGRAPVKKKRTRARAEELPPLDLMEEAPRDNYLAKVRRAAQDGLHAPTGREPPSPRSGRVRRLAAAVAGLIMPLLLGEWYMQAHSDAASAARPEISASAPGAQANALAADYRRAVQLIEAGNTADGVALLRRAADGDFAVAQYRLAQLYESGRGVPADLAQARQWTERAAAGGNVHAMHDLGVYFARGEGGAPQDNASAFRWFRQAAEFGVAGSQYNLGLLYQAGRGVHADAAEALFWFLVACGHGEAAAAAHISAVEADLSPMQIEQTRQRAQAFTPRAANPLANLDTAAP